MVIKSKVEWDLILIVRQYLSGIIFFIITKISILKLRLKLIEGRNKSGLRTKIFLFMLFCGN